MDKRCEYPVNFRGHIAIFLEKIAKRRLSGRDFTADGIESGNFVAIMALIVGNHGDTEEAEAFLKGCSAYLGKSAGEIPLDAAMEMYEKFKTLIGED